MHLGLPRNSRDFDKDLNTWGYQGAQQILTKTLGGLQGGDKRSKTILKRQDKTILLSANEPKPYLAKYACSDRIHLFLHSSETFQYNSNVLTLVAVTCNVAGLIDVSEVC